MGSKSLGHSVHHLHILKSQLRIHPTAREKFTGNGLLRKALTQVDSCYCHTSIYPMVTFWVISTFFALKVVTLFPTYSSSRNNLEKQTH